MPMLLGVPWGRSTSKGFVLDVDSLRLWQRWVRGSITLEQLGSLFDDLIYSHCPEARIDPPVASN